MFWVRTEVLVVLLVGFTKVEKLLYLSFWGPWVFRVTDFL